MDGALSGEGYTAYLCQYTPPGHGERGNGTLPWRMAQAGAAMPPCRRAALPLAIEPPYRDVVAAGTIERQSRCADSWRLAVVHWCRRTHALIAQYPASCHPFAVRTARRYRTQHQRPAASRPLSLILLPGPPPLLLRFSACLRCPLLTLNGPSTFALQPWMPSSPGPLPLPAPSCPLLSHRPISPLTRQSSGQHSATSLARCILHPALSLLVS